jgi:putative addiction module killer protein
MASPRCHRPVSPRNIFRFSEINRLAQKNAVVEVGVYGWKNLACNLVTYMVPYAEFELRTYVDEHGQVPFETWILELNGQAQAKVTTALSRLERGNMSNVEAVGEGVSELKLNWGPGYRVYFGQDGRTIIILLCGGTKKRQSRDIAFAKARWASYKLRRSATPR